MVFVDKLLTPEPKALHLFLIIKNSMHTVCPILLVAANISVLQVVL